MKLPGLTLTCLRSSRNRIRQKFPSFSRTAFLFLTLASCGKKQESTDLTVGFTSTRNYAIDAKATSCKAQHDYMVAVTTCSISGNCSSAPVPTNGDVGGPNVSFGRMFFNWARTEPLRIIYMKFTFRGPALTGGKFEYTMADTELWTTWRQGYFRSPPTNPTLPDAISAAETAANAASALAGGPKIRDESKLTYSDCDVILPGVPIQKKDTSTTIPGTVFVYGYYETAEGSRIPVTATGTGLSIDWLSISN